MALAWCTTETGGDGGKEESEKEREGEMTWGECSKERNGKERKTGVAGVNQEKHQDEEKGQ